MTPAELCRRNGWAVGQFLQAEVTFTQRSPPKKYTKNTIILITAIGYEKVLVKHIMQKGTGGDWEPCDNEEMEYELTERHGWYAIQQLPPYPDVTHETR